MKTMLKALFLALTFTTATNTLLYGSTERFLGEVYSASTNTRSTDQKKRTYGTLCTIHSMIKNLDKMISEGHIPDHYSELEIAELPALKAQVISIYNERAATHGFPDYGVHNFDTGYGTMPIQAAEEVSPNCFFTLQAPHRCEITPEDTYSVPLADGEVAHNHHHRCMITQTYSPNGGATCGLTYVDSSAT